MADIALKTSELHLKVDHFNNESQNVDQTDEIRRFLIASFSELLQRKIPLKVRLDWRDLEVESQTKIVKIYDSSGTYTINKHSLLKIA